jgi:hypothetical protein
MPGGANLRRLGRPVFHRLAVLCSALLLAGLLAGCTSGQPVTMSPTASTQAFRTDADPTTVYDRIYTRMDLCHAVHNVFSPGVIVSGADSSGRPSRIYFARDGLALWGADIEPAGNGSRVTTRIGKDAASDRYHALIRTWVEARRRQQPGETDC